MFGDYINKHEITRVMAFGRALLEMKNSGATFNSADVVV